MIIPIKYFFFSHSFSHVFVVLFHYLLTAAASRVVVVGALQVPGAGCEGFVRDGVWYCNQAGVVHIRVGCDNFRAGCLFCW